MGTVIEAFATATAHRRPFAPGSLKLADTAALTCLEHANRMAGELGLLINAGVYHDKILGEPAFASLIQEDIGANPGDPPDTGHGTFSFDIYNGGCGVLTGMHLVDGLLASGAVELGMVVASDTNPQPGVTREFAFPAVGGAVLLSKDDSRAGFRAFRFATFPEFADLFCSHVDWEDDARRGLVHHGRNILTIEIVDTYATRALECAESTAREMAAEEALDLADVDLLVATASVPRFGEALAERLGVAAENVASLPDDLALAHTAGPLVALDPAELAAARNALFVCAGAGITVAAALYGG